MNTKEQTSKTRFRKRIVAMAASALLVAASVATALPAQAVENNVPPAGDDLTWHFNKYLVMDKDANAPDVTFTFDITAGGAVDAKGGNPAIYAGNDSLRVEGNPDVGFADFDPSDPTYTQVQGNDKVTLGTEKAYAKKSVTVDFQSVKFKAPGIYRYIITEKASSADGITNDATTTRTLDVFVKYTNEVAGGQLEVSNYVVYRGTKTDAANVDAGSKDDGFTNTYATTDLTLKKQVTGNQGDRDKYFEFTVVISGAVEGTIYDVNLSDADTNPTVGETPPKTNAASLTVGEDGTVTAIYYLKDDQSIVVQGLTSDTNYTITETDYSKDGYTTSYVLDSAPSVQASTTSEQNMGNAAHVVTFTNAKNGTVPTGILLETAPYLVLGVVVLAGLTVLFMTRRRRVR